MIASTLPLFVALPLIAAGLLIVFGERPLLHRLTLFTILGFSLLGGIVLIREFVDGGALAHGVGMWPVGIAIPFAADMFTALMLVVTGLLTIVCAAFAYVSQQGSNRFFAPLILALTAGVNGALLTADIFNMFVFIEVMLLPSYALFFLAPSGKAPLRRIAGARLYVTLNLLTSTIFLIGVGFVYGTAGTVNMAELAGIAKENGAVAFAVALCLFALSIKAAAVPVHGWLARAYPTTSPAITALFSGLHTKVAIYGIYRIYAVIFDGDSTYLWVGVLLFCLTMILGVFGAVGENTTRSILAFHMVSQIGYILLGVALFTQLGLTAGIFYLLHHMIVKASLFLSTGAIEVRYGSGQLGTVTGMLKKEPWIAATFFIAALSLAGIPPFSGFVAKLSLIMASIDAGQVAAAVVMVIVSLITLLSMLKIWSGVFWTKHKVDPVLDDADPTTFAAIPALDTPVADGDTATAVATRPRIGLALAAPSMVLALITISLGLGGELLLGLAETAAAGLLDTSSYIQAVMGS